VNPSSSSLSSFASSQRPKNAQASSNNDESISSTTTSSPDMIAAASVSQSLSVISKVVNARCELIGIHADIISFQRQNDYSHNIGHRENENDDNSNSIKDTEEDNGNKNDLEEETDDDDDDDCNSERNNASLMLPSPQLLSLSKRCDAIALMLIDIDLTKKSSTTDGKDDDVDDNCISAPKNPVSSVVKNIIHETKALSAALAAIYYLEKCSFFETVVNARILKVQLSHVTPFHLEPTSAVQAWMRMMMVRLIGCMSVVFDRIDAYSSFSRGFQRNVFKCFDDKNDEDVSNDDQISLNKDRRLGDGSIESAILTFVCEQQVKSGPPLAVAAILNVDHGSPPEFEQGFIFPRDGDGGEEKEEKEEEEKDFFVDVARRWPAIYMRTTLRSAMSGTNQISERSAAAASSATMGRIQGNLPGTTFTKAIMKLTGELNLNQGQDEDKQKAKNSLSRSPSVTVNSSHVDGAKVAPLEDIQNVRDILMKSSFNQNNCVDPKIKEREYWPGCEEDDWPHSEWPSIVSVLADDPRRCLAHPASAEKYASENPPYGAFTYRENPQQAKSQKSSTFFSSSDGLSKANSTDSDQDTSKRSSLLSLFSTKKFPSVSSFASPTEGILDSPLRSVTSSNTMRRIPEARETSLNNSERGSRRPSFSIMEHSPQPSQTSSYHAVRIGPKLWIVVIVKRVEEKWHRKRTRGHTGEEIRSFLNSMASKLSLYGALGTDAVFKARDVAPQLGLSSSDGKETLASLWASGKWQDSEMHLFLNSMKSMLGLKPNSPRLEPLKSPYISQPGSSSRRNNQTMNRSQQSYGCSDSESTLGGGIDFETSAMSFFLGPDLFQYLPTD